MIAGKLCFLLPEAAFVLLFLRSGSGLALAAALLPPLLVLLALPLNLYLRRKLTVSLEMPVNLRKGEQGEGRLLLENPTLLPVLRLGCRMEAENCLTGQRQSLRLDALLLPRQKRSVPFALGDALCGRVKLRLTELRLYDPFGLIPVRRKLSMHRSATVQPETFRQELLLDLLAGQGDDSDSYSPYRPGSDVSETFQIREYVEGDSLRQIHWKLTGKLDKLIVRDASLPVIRSVLLFWERDNRRLSPRLMDAQAEVLLTLCRSLLDQSVFFTIGWNEPAEQRCILHNVTSMDDLVAMMPRMLSMQGTEQGLSGLELLLDELGGKHFSRILCVCHEESAACDALRGLGRLSLFHSGSGTGTAFDEENYADQLSRLIL